jgi:hypothetical protein
MPIRTHRKMSITAPLLTLLLASTASAADLSVRDFGTAGDGKTLDSPAIQKAIDTCSQNGGGKVHLPPGKYLTGTILLKDNVTLAFDKGASLIGSTNLEDYQNIDPFTDGLGIQVGWALLGAVKAKNVGIEGEGIIDGQGKAVADRQGGKASEVWGRRPFLVRMVQCDGVSLKDANLRMSAAWTTNLFQCKNVTIENIKIESRGVPHNDGIDLDGCQSVTIKNCDIDSGDDAICFKTTSSAMACKDIQITGCKLKSGQGAIKTGTESMANFENIKISNCQIRDTKHGGIKLLAVDGAHLQNIDISDITMDNVQTPIFIRLGKRLNVFRKGESKQEIGALQNVSIKNIKATNSQDSDLKPPTGIFITGIAGHPINNVSLENIDITLPGGGTREDAQRSVIEEEAKAYPEVNRFAPGLPSYGLYARHVKNLSLKNITIKTEKPDLRPALLLEDAATVNLTGFKLTAYKGATSIIECRSVNSAQITNFTLTGDPVPLLQSDKNSTDIQQK